MIAKYIIDFDFYLFETIFFITTIINLILIITVDNDEKITRYSKYGGLVITFGYSNFIFNFFVIFIWVIIKFPLYYKAESHELDKKLKSEKEERNEGIKELNLSCFSIHLRYGIRYDGSMADRIEAASYTYEKEYYIGRFFYEELYFLF